MFALLAKFSKTLKTAFPFFPSLLLLDNLYRNSYFVDLAKKKKAKKLLRLYYDPPPASLFQDAAGCSALAPRREYFFSPRVMGRMSKGFVLNNKCGWEPGALLLDPKK